MQSYSTTAGDDFPNTHPVLKPMRATAERMFEAGDNGRAFNVLHALAVLNGKPSFLRGSAHQHFTAGDGAGQVRHE